MITTKAIKIKIYQDTANYRVPFTSNPRSSYPLPPFSTVIGMICAVCGFTKYHPMKISIQGNFAGSHDDYMTKYDIGSSSFAKELANYKKHLTEYEQYQKDLRQYKKDKAAGLKVDELKSVRKPQLRFTFGAGDVGVTRGTDKVQVLDNVNLVLHIIPENQDEVEEIYQGLLNPKEYPTLGRREDLAMIEDVKIVDLQSAVLDEDYVAPVDDNKHQKLAAYLPMNFLHSVETDNRDTHNSNLDAGTFFKLNKDYQLAKIGTKRNGKAQYHRLFNHVRALHNDNYVIYADEKVLLDNDGMAVFPA